MFLLNVSAGAGVFDVSHRPDKSHVEFDVWMLAAILPIQLMCVALGSTVRRSFKATATVLSPMYALPQGDRCVR